MNTTVVPINTTRTVHCIIQDEVKYCESNPMTKQEGGLVALLVAGLILWFMFWSWVSFKVENRYGIYLLVPLLLGGFVLPSMVIGLVLLF